MACGATLKRHREFDPLQNSPDRSPKRLCLPIDLMSPSSSSHSRLLNGTAFVEAAHKLIHDKLTRMSPGREKQLVDVTSSPLRSNCTSSTLVSSPWPNKQAKMANQAWPVIHSSAASQAWPITESPAANQVWPDNRQQSHVNMPKRKEQLFTMKQVNAICRSFLKEHEERVREEFDNILTNKLAEQYEGLLSFNQAQIHNRFDNSDASYVS